MNFWFSTQERPGGLYWFAAITVNAQSVTGLVDEPISHPFDWVRVV